MSIFDRGFQRVNTRLRVMKTWSSAKPKSKQTQVSAIGADTERPPTEHCTQHFSCQFELSDFKNLMTLSKLLSYRSILLRNDKCEINQFLTVFQTANILKS